LPWEANPKWPSEALKAQAVVSRTYALFRAIEKKDEWIHLAADVKSQVYAGKSSEKPQTSEAVDATRGQILTYRGKIFPAYFHSTCGGGTTNAESIWDVEKHPVLQGVKCNFCVDSKHYSWQITIPRQQIEAHLKKHGLSVSGIQKITPSHLDAHGRARSFVIEHAQGKTEIRANDFRLWLNPAVLKSTFIRSIHPTGDSFIFRGRGWGHGAGLCQYGMKGLAELGYTYRQILEYYYPGAEIKKI
jgi:stage II sporulation protein D